MKSRPTEPIPRFGWILPGEVMPVEEAARRLGWRKRLTIDVQRMGLRSVLIGGGSIQPAIGYANLSRSRRTGKQRKGAGNEAHA